MLDEILMVYIHIALPIGIVYLNFLIAKVITRVFLPLRLRDIPKTRLTVNIIVTIVLTGLILLLIGNSHILVI